MDIFHINSKSVTLNPVLELIQLRGIAKDPQASSFLWCDVTHEEVALDPDAWRDQIERMTGIRVYDLHLKDVLNLNHPSYFESTQDYELIVFQKLALAHEGESASIGPIANEDRQKKLPAALQKLHTLPISFLLIENMLITVRKNQSRTIEQTRNKLLSYQHREENFHASRLPNSPIDLMLRLLNLMVDQYLDLRQPLTQQLDRWQRALLDPRRPFNNWVALLDSRIEIRKLDHLCEDQYDALQELRDHLIDSFDANNELENSSRTNDILLVRINDVMEHVNRVLNHARRLEASIESSVQIHFAAMAHRTSTIMRTLTIITAIFMPLTLLTGVFGMNFAHMPLLKNIQGFWIIVGVMCVIVLILIIFFQSQRYFEGRQRSPHSH
jgi:Mg2+ and Co2+ transporter CorA